MFDVCVKHELHLCIFFLESVMTSTKLAINISFCLLLLYVYVQMMNACVLFQQYDFGLSVG